MVDTGRLALSSREWLLPFERFDLFVRGRGSFLGNCCSKFFFDETGIVEKSRHVMTVQVFVRPLPTHVCTATRSVTRYQVKQGFGCIKPSCLGLVPGAQQHKESARLLPTTSEVLCTQWRRYYPHTENGGFIWCYPGRSHGCFLFRVVAHYHADVIHLLP